MVDSSFPLVVVVGVEAPNHYHLPFPETFVVVYLQVCLNYFRVLTAASIVFPLPWVVVEAVVDSTN